jgi:Transposase and inactivated derivatives
MAEMAKQTLVIGDPSGVKDNLDRHSDKRLHDWGDSVLAAIPEYTCLEQGIKTMRDDERARSRCYSRCGHVDGDDRVQRGLWDRSSCGAVSHGELNGADNLRQQALPTTSPMAVKLAGDSGTESVAPLVVSLCDRTQRFHPRNRVESYTPDPSNPVSASGKGHSDSPHNVADGSESPRL